MLRVGGGRGTLAKGDVTGRVGVGRFVLVDLISCS